MLGDFEKALEYYDKALDIDPEHEIAMFYKKIILNRHK
jgi:tetratricopeptide (TPR) repeat protein